MKGLWTALVTPFKNEALDESGLRANIAFQKKNHVDGIVALGTTGESPTLTEDECERIVAICKESGLPLMVGTGTNCTRTTIEKTRWAKERGADFALIIAPYYNRPPQEGIYAHYMAVADAVDIPLVVYNHPGRTGVNIKAATLKRLAEHPHIVAVKECSGDFAQVKQILEEIPQLSVMSGDDSLYKQFMEMGAHGLISVLSNLIPALMRDWERHEELAAFFEASALETNPIPIKAMMTLAGMAAGPCRLPLTPPNVETLRWLNEMHALPL